MNVNVVDCSFWQEKIDFSVLNQKAHGIILRAGQGLREDLKYKLFRDGAKQVGMLYGNYFYYDNRVHPKRQAEKWADIIGDDEGKLGSWLDIEQEVYTDYKGYKHWWDCVENFKIIKPNSILGIYTRASYFNDPNLNIPENHAFRNLPLWVAHYNRFVTNPDLPKGWNTWLFWQHSDHGDGIAHGVGSKEIDLNYFNGSLEDFRIRYNLTDQPKRTGSRLLAEFENETVQYKESSQ